MLSSGYLCVLGSESKWYQNTMQFLPFLAEITENFYDSVRFSDELWRPFYQQFLSETLLPKLTSGLAGKNSQFFPLKLQYEPVFCWPGFHYLFFQELLKQRLNSKGIHEHQTHGSGVYRQLPVSHEVSCYFFVRWRQDILFEHWHKGSGWKHWHLKKDFLEFLEYLQHFLQIANVIWWQAANNLKWVNMMLVVGLVESFDHREKGVLLKTYC